MIIFKENMSRLVEEDEVLNTQELVHDLDAGGEDDASKSDLADAVTAEVELATGGKETYSDAKANEIAEKQKPIILSAGMCYMSEVETALTEIHKINRKNLKIM